MQDSNPYTIARQFIFLCSIGFPRIKNGRYLSLKMGNNDHYGSSASVYGSYHNKADAVNSSVDCDGSAFWTAASGNK
jgi:hypothetical protein